MIKLLVLLILLMIMLPAWADSQNIAVFYSKTTGRIRWVLDPDSDREIQNIVSKNPGEAVLLLPRNQNVPIDKLQVIINSKTGKTPTNDRYIVVDPKTGNVENMIIADPDGCGDKIDGKLLIQHATADQRWHYDPIAKTLSAPAK